MRRLLVHVEGVTERNFVNELLRPHLIGHGYGAVSARLFGKALRSDRRGGARPWAEVRRSIIAHLQEDRGCFATTMVDYYGMPAGWPGRKSNSGRTSRDKACSVEAAMAMDVARHGGRAFDPRRFRPCVVMHEFEALLFSDSAAFAIAVRRPDLKDKLNAIRADFVSPEDINDATETAPSRRIIALEPRYQKDADGPRAAMAIGLDRIRAACPHFNAWLSDLETWPARLPEG